MAVTVTEVFVESTADGVQTSFPYNFYVLRDEHIHVFFDGDQITTGFVVLGVGEQEGGSVDFDDPPAGGVTVRLQREVPITQLVEYEDYGAFPPVVQETALDKLTMICQQLDALVKGIIELITDGGGAPLPGIGLGHIVLDVNTPMPQRLHLSFENCELTDDEDNDVTRVRAIGGGEGGDLLTTKGDLVTHDGGSTVRLGVTSDGYVLVSDSTTATGLKWAAFSGGGIGVPSDVPVPVGGIVTYANTSGTQAQGNPDTAILGNHKLTSVDGTVLEIASLLGGGTTLHIAPGDGGSSISITVPAGADHVNNPVVIESPSAALDVTAGGNLTLNGMHWNISAPAVPGPDTYLRADETSVFIGNAPSATQPEVVETGYLE